MEQFVTKSAGTFVYNFEFYIGLVLSSNVLISDNVLKLNIWQISHHSSFHFIHINISQNAMVSHIKYNN